MNVASASREQTGVQGQAAESSSGVKEAAGPLRIDPEASAALARAITSAKQGVRPGMAPSKEADGDAREASAKAPGPTVSPFRPMAQAAVAVLLIGAGWSASYLGTLANRDAIHRLESETARSQEILARLSQDLNALKGTVAAFTDVEQTASVTSAADQSKLMQQVERLAAAAQAPGARFTLIETRLDRMQEQIMASLAGLAAKPPAPTPAPAPVPAAAPAPVPAVTEAVARESAPPAKSIKAEPVEGWVLREVYDGAALVEGRNGRLYEVAPGGAIPGVGRVEAIERRGKAWVVQTDKGVIGAYR